MDQVNPTRITAAYSPGYADAHLVAATINMLVEEIDELREQLRELYDTVHNVDPGDE